MLIDWFTVGAQVFNFLILIWLLKRFLYRPILDAIDAREKSIETTLADASKKMADAQREQEVFRNKNESFDQQRAALLSKACAEVSEERQRLLNEARQASDTLRTKRLDALNQEQQAFNGQIIRKTRKEVFAIARKMLTDLAGITLEERMAEVFVTRLLSLDNQARHCIATALSKPGETALIRSVAVLPLQRQDAIRAALNTILPPGAELRFEIDPELVSGIELNVCGQKLAWSIGDYLSSLEKNIGEVLKQQFRPQEVSGVRTTNNTDVVRAVDANQVPAGDIQ